MIVSDGEYIYMTIGADYQGNDNYIASFNKNTHNIRIVFRALESYAVEGILFHNDQIMVVNDGLFHDAIIPKTYISIYDLETEQ